MVVSSAWQTNGRFRGIARMCYGCGHGTSLTDCFDRDFWEPWENWRQCRTSWCWIPSEIWRLHGARNYARQKPVRIQQPANPGLSEIDAANDSPGRELLGGLRIFLGPRLGAALEQGVVERQ